MAYIALQDVTKVYKTGEIEIHAADGITFEMEKGEFVVIAGAGSCIFGVRPLSFVMSV